MNSIEAMNSLEAMKERLQLEWSQLYTRCFVFPWSWGILQPEYVYLPAPLTIIDDSDNFLKFD